MNATIYQLKKEQYLKRGKHRPSFIGRKPGQNVSQCPLVSLMSTSLGEGLQNVSEIFPLTAASLISPRKVET